jgi:hypothetical protein
MSTWTAYLLRKDEPRFSPLSRLFHTIIRPSSFGENSLNRQAEETLCHLSTRP